MHRSNYFYRCRVLELKEGLATLLQEDVNQNSHKRIKPGQLDTAIKTELGHINTKFYWFINLKMYCDYKTTLICGQPILDCTVPYLFSLQCTNQSNKFQHFYAELPYKGIYQNVKNTSFMHTSVKLSLAFKTVPDAVMGFTC